MPYPNDIDNFNEPQSNDLLTAPSHSTLHRDTTDAIVAVETELGTTPSGSFESVRARLEDIENKVVISDTEPQASFAGQIWVDITDPAAPILNLAVEIP